MLLWYKELGDINADGYIVLKVSNYPSTRNNLHY